MTARTESLKDLYPSAFLPDDIKSLMAEGHTPDRAGRILVKQKMLQHVEDIHNVEDVKQALNFIIENLNGV